MIQWLGSLPGQGHGVVRSWMGERDINPGTKGQDELFGRDCVYRDFIVLFQ